MAHPRKLIRHAIVARLLGATAAGSRVQATRVEPHRKTQLPAISVYTAGETISIDADALTAPQILVRAAEVKIAAWVTGPTDPEGDVADAMDDIAEQIEAAMDADRYLGGLRDGLARDILLESTEMAVRGAEGGDPLIGIITLTYRVTYDTSPAVGQLDDFRRVDARTQIAGASPGNAIEDLVSLEAP